MRLRTMDSVFTMSSIWARNHGSMAVSACTSSSDMPRRNASPTYQMRSGPASPISSTTSSRSVDFSSRPSTPTSRPRSAFWNDSWKVRPMAITSPTDFIWVVRWLSACGNFSKAKRGTLVTT
ncbi:hypothetical protein D3C81_1056450 [compost metagenome]